MRRPPNHVCILGCFSELSTLIPRLCLVFSRLYFPILALSALLCLFIWNPFLLLSRGFSLLLSPALIWLLAFVFAVFLPLLSTLCPPSCWPVSLFALPRAANFKAAQPIRAIPHHGNLFPSSDLYRAAVAYSSFFQLPLWVKTVLIMLWPLSFKCQIGRLQAQQLSSAN